MDKHKHKYLKSRRLLGELFLAGLVLIAFYLLAGEFQASERLYGLLRRMERFQLDELLLGVIVVGPLYLAVFAYRRMREIKVLVREASTDALTGMLNRRRAIDLLTREVRRSHRYGRELSLILFDIDYFKEINDTYGHPVGDQVLRLFATLVTSRIRDLDLLARTGGEEFMIIATETGRDGAADLAERLREAVESTSFGIDRSVTASFGVAQLRRGESFASLMQRADERLYWAKRQGRNRVAGAVDVST